MTALAWTARQPVRPDPEPEVPDDSLDSYHRALLVDPANTPEQVAALFRVIVPILVMWRQQAGPLAVKRLAVEPVLDDPAHDDHPARASWMHQYAQLCREEMDAMHHVVKETWGLHRFWRHLSPRERKEYGLDGLVGLHHCQQDLGRHVAFITTGPLQEQAPLPDPYEPPEPFIRELVPTFWRMLDRPPF